LQALKFFEALYEVERLARQTPGEGETRADYTLRLRQQHSLPVLAAFKTWLDDLAPKVLPESFTGKAISYAQNQWDYLIRYTSNGLAPIDNNGGNRGCWRAGSARCPRCASPSWSVAARRGAVAIGAPADGAAHVLPATPAPASAATFRNRKGRLDRGRRFCWRLLCGRSMWTGPGRDCEASR
jgi:Transposase IS66 family